MSKLVFDWLAGWDTGRQNEDGPLVAPGKLAAFSNEEHGRWRQRPNSILVDSQQLASGEGMTAEFKAIAAAESEEFKAEYRARFPGRDIDDLTDEDLLREVMNTVGKAGKLGEHVRCVVSVSMLTEGWDANTVTHILGVRAFGTQLLCEQVVGRGLRRMSYAPNAKGLLDPYGLNVDWEVLVTAGKMKSVEVFYNFMIMDANMNVFMRNPARVTQEQAARMDRVWGDGSWRPAAYRSEPDLFGEHEEKVTNEEISEAFRQRLEKVAGFAYVPPPMPMRNTRGAVVYYLYFASPNATAGRIVTEIFERYRERGAV